MWCGGHVIWCDVIACVVSCHVMQRDVVWCVLMWWAVICCALQWDGTLWALLHTVRCHWLWGHLGGSKWFCDDAVIQITVLYVLQSTTLCCKVLLQYYSVSTTPVLLRTAKYYCTTTKLLQYYLLCTTPATKYYNILLQHYSVLQSATPVLPCITKYYSSTSLYYKALQSTTPVVPRTLYKVLVQYYSVLQSNAHEWSSSRMKRWNVIYSARSNRCHPPTSPNTAPATQDDSHDWSFSHMKRHLQCAEQHGATGITLQPDQILRLQRKIAIQHLREICRKQLKRRLQCAAYSTMIRTWNCKTEPARSPRATHLVLKIITTCRAPAIYQNFTEYCACHEKCHCNITKDCACHEKQHCNITKYCTCHEKWPPGVTK